MSDDWKWFLVGVWVGLVISAIIGTLTVITMEINDWRDRRKRRKNDAL
jgi:uncharacterized protein (DUF2062 family)